CSGYWQCCPPLRSFTASLTLTSRRAFLMPTKPRKPPRKLPPLKRLPLPAKPNHKLHRSRDRSLRSISLFLGRHLGGCGNCFAARTRFSINDQPCNALAMKRRVSEHRLRRFGAAKVKMKVVLPGKSHAAVDLDAAISNVARGVARIHLG